MPISKEELKLATDKKFTEFSKAVKDELKSKLNNHPTVKKHISDYEKIQQMKDSFKKIADIDSKTDNKSDNTDDVSDKSDNKSDNTDDKE